VYVCVGHLVEHDAHLIRIGGASKMRHTPLANSRKDSFNKILRFFQISAVAGIISELRTRRFIDVPGFDFVLEEIHFVEEQNDVSLLKPL